MELHYKKVYAAFTSGLVSNGNLLQTYFRFLATIIAEDKLTTIDSTEIANKFEEKYKINLTGHMIRQIFSYALQKKFICKGSNGLLYPQREAIDRYVINTDTFDKNWEELIDLFFDYCQKAGYDYSKEKIQNKLLALLDIYDVKLIDEQDFPDSEHSDKFPVQWKVFLTKIAKSHPLLFDFTVSLCYGNIAKQALFYSGDGRKNLDNLIIYLDSPIIFGLLGLDTPSRVDSCRYLVTKAIEAGCTVKIFDNNYNEVQQIILNATEWIGNPNFDIAQANSVATYFVENQKNKNEALEFSALLETKLNSYGVTKQATSYEAIDEKFQEDEGVLFEMIQEKYTEHGQSISPQREESIRTDVRSIVMVYRERKGITAVNLGSCVCLFLTLNNAIANVSKAYANNKPGSHRHIPACISADLFGTLLWLFSPQLLEFQRKQLLADCYACLDLTPEIRKKYTETLTRALDNNEITEEQFFLLRSFNLISDYLLNITYGDYARISDQTPQELLEQIKSQEEKKYVDKLKEYETSKEQVELRLALVEKDNKELKARNKEIQQKLEQEEKKKKAEQERKLQKKIKMRTNVCTLVTFGLLYFLVVGGTELLKTQVTILPYPSYVVYLVNGAYIIIPIIMICIYKKGFRLWEKTISKNLGKKE